MNAHAPPKRESRPARAALENLHRDTRHDFHATQLRQDSLRAWQREAVRLFHEFWRTGWRAHLDAFGRHVVAMQSRITRKASHKFRRKDRQNTNLKRIGDVLGPKQNQNQN